MLYFSLDIEGEEEEKMHFKRIGWILVPNWVGVPLCLLGMLGFTMSYQIMPANGWDLAVGIVGTLLVVVGVVIFRGRDSYFVASERAFAASRRSQHRPF